VRSEMGVDTLIERAAELRNHIADIVAFIF
jgi:hypothetical protein